MCRVLPIDQSEITLFDPVADKARRERLWKAAPKAANEDGPVIKETVANFTVNDRVGGKVIQTPSEWKNKRMPKIAYVKKTAAHNPPPIELKKIVTPLDLTKELLRGISEKYDVHIDNMLGQCRKKEFVTARMHAYYHLHIHHGFSYPKIGRLFNKDHTTVMHGVRRQTEILAAREAAE